MKRELLVNPIIIPTISPFGRIEHVLYADGTRVIFAVKRDSNDELTPAGTVAEGKYTPKGIITDEVQDKISSKDEQLLKISSELAKRYRFRFEFLESDFRNLQRYISMQLEGEIGSVTIYLCGFVKNVKFGPVVQVFTKMERMSDVRSYQNELKAQVELLYGECGIYQTRGNGFSIFREI